jgi:hypothetical protein
MAGMWLSSIEAITVGPAGQYATVGETGTFSADAAGTLRFSGGFLAGRVAHLKESDGKPAIVFIRDENEVGGEPTIDASDTWCYFEPR